MREPCGVVCATVTWTLMLYAQLVLWWEVVAPANDPLIYGEAALFELLWILALAAHMRAMFSDPVLALTLDAYTLLTPLIIRVHHSPTTSVFSLPPAYSIKHTGTGGPTTL